MTRLTAGLLVDQARNTLDTSTTGKTPDSWLGDTLDVITEDFSVPLGSTLSKALSSLAASRHVIWLQKRVGSRCK